MAKATDYIPTLPAGTIRIPSDLIEGASPDTDLTTTLRDLAARVSALEARRTTTPAKRGA